MIPGASFGFRVIVLEETGLLQRLVNQLSINNKKSDYSWHIDRNDVSLLIWVKNVPQ